MEQEAPPQAQPGPHTQRTVFLLTAYVHSAGQGGYVVVCVTSIREHHPDATIVVLDGDSPNREWVPAVVALGAVVERQPRPGCSMVNPFVWAALDATASTGTAPTRYVYVHDSARLIAPLPLDLRPGVHFVPLWYSSHGASVDMEHADIAATLTVDGVSIAEDVDWHRHRRGGALSLGGMGVWDTEFASALAQRTNLVDAARLFYNKGRGCMWERVVYILARRLGALGAPPSGPNAPAVDAAFTASALCGDANGHANAFHNMDQFCATPGNPYVCKVWVSQAGGPRAHY